MVLIGSQAIKYWYPDFPREPKDWDYAVNNREALFVSSSKSIEYHLNPHIYGVPQSPNFTVLSAEHLLTLKMSHIFWDINWSKHMFDIQFLLRKGNKLDFSLFHKLYEFWPSIHSTNKRSDLKMTADKFFDNALKTYDHDFLHTLLNAVPTYTKVLKDGSEVEPDEEKFEALSHSDKLALVREEVYVMAFERIGDRDYREAYGWMLKKFIISHAPIWEAIWIIENYIELHKPLINYQKLLQDELSRNQ